VLFLFFKNQNKQNFEDVLVRFNKKIKKAALQLAEPPKNHSIYYLM